MIQFTVIPKKQFGTRRFGKTGKQIGVPKILPKKSMNEFFFFAIHTFTAKKTYSFVCFLGESTVRQSVNGFIWPLVCLTFLWWQVFLREPEKIIYTYFGPITLGIQTSVHCFFLPLLYLGPLLLLTTLNSQHCTALWNYFSYYGKTSNYKKYVHICKFFFFYIWNLYFYVSGQSGPFWAMLKLL